jgi:hypothetical protein
MKDVLRKIQQLFDNEVFLITFVIGVILLGFLTLFLIQQFA